MGMDARLQGLQAGASLGFDLLLPLMLDVEIAQRQQGDDAADRLMTGDDRQQSRGVGAKAGAEARISRQPQGWQRTQQRDGLGDAERRQRGRGGTEAGQPAAPPTEHCRNPQRHPLHEQ